jgi:L-lactate dehydrogenase complex protein LldG
MSSEGVAVDDGTVARYESQAATVDIETSRATAADATDAIAAACRGDTVASPLPFDVALPERVTVDPSMAAVEAAETGVTAGTVAVAEYGTVVVTPTDGREGAVSLFPPRHVAVVRASDVVPDMLAGFDRLADAFAAGDDDAVLVTGPSATADMGEMVQGVHGPAEMHVVIVDTDRGRRE